LAVVDSTSTRDIQAERAQLRETLHRRGMRMTPQRQLVLDALLELEHATPEQVCQQVQRSTPSVNITTVYRTLELLENLGIVRHTHLGHGAPNYSVHEHDHVHLVCHRCGRVIEAPRETMEPLRGTLRADYGFVVDVSHLALSGHCRDCAAQETP
jgi:Fur family transcriptional regulator, ferric uptake regulator